METTIIKKNNTITLKNRQGPIVGKQPENDILTNVGLQG
jgi:hypothetical protein